MFPGHKHLARMEHSSGAGGVGSVRSRVVGWVEDIIDQSIDYFINQSTNQPLITPISVNCFLLFSASSLVPATLH